MKLFCLAYAGGSAATIFSRWVKLNEKKLEIIPLEYKGRGMKYDSYLEPDFNSTIEYLFDDIRSYLKEEEPYAIYGHSLGALFAYELCKEIEASSFKNPDHVFLASSKSPIHSMEYDLSNLRKILEDYGGTPREVLDDEEIFDYFKPILLNDFGLYNDYCFEKTGKLNVKVTILYGTRDSSIDIKEVSDWETLFLLPIDLVAIDGDHFFINDDKGEVLKIVHEKLVIPI